MDPIEHLKLRLIAEPDFRKQLLDDPEAALRAVSIEPSEEILSIIKDLKADLEKLSKELGVPWVVP